MNNNIESIGNFFASNKTLWPPILTGCVTIMVFLLTIFLNNRKEHRKTKKDDDQRIRYLMNLLEDVVHHIKTQTKELEKAATLFNSDPTSFQLLNYMPINYLERISTVLANDNYFSSFNRNYKTVEDDTRVRFYNDFAIDIDLFYNSLKELYKNVERGFGHHEKFTALAFELSEALLRATAQLGLDIANNPKSTEMDHKLSLLLDSMDKGSMQKAFNSGDLNLMRTNVAVPIHKIMIPFLSLDSVYNIQILGICERCQNFNREYSGIINTNLELGKAFDDMKDRLNATLSRFIRKLEILNPPETKK